MGRDGSGDRVGLKERRKVETLAEGCSRPRPLLCHYCCRGCGPALWQGTCETVAHVVTQAPGNPGCGSFPGAPMAAGSDKDGTPPLLCTPQLQLGQGGSPRPSTPDPAPSHGTRPITFLMKHLTTLLSPKPSPPPNPHPKARAGSKGRCRRAVLSKWHTDLLDLLITLGYWCPPVPTWGGGHGTSGAGTKRCHFHPPSHPGWVGMAPNKTNLSIISLSLYKYRIYIYLCRYIYIDLLSLERIKG